MSDGTAESAASYTVTLDVSAVNDPATGLPTISGTARVGQLLTAGVSAIADDADGLPEVSTFTWQWLRASGGTDTAISGATSQTYTVAAADAGKKFKVTVSFTDLDGHPEALTSVAYPADRQVAANDAPTGADKTVTLAEDGSYTFKAADFGFTDTDTDDALASVKIVTPPTAGKGTLKLDTTAVTANGSVTKAALDAGDLVYMPPADANGSAFASFTFKVSDGTAESASSYTMTVDVSAVNDPATGLPTISGTARVGQLLTAGVSAIADDADGLPEVSTFTWQWLRASGGTDTAISGATSQTYTVAAADAGKKFKVTVSFTDLDGHPEALTSVAYPADRQVAANAAPTGSDKTVTLAEDGSYTFKAADFGFTDTDTDDALASVKIVTPPTAGKGTLKLDTTAVTANGSVTKAALDAGDLVYEPPANANGDDYASFAFKVSDGTAESAASYTVTLDVSAVNDPATGLPTISGTARVGQLLTAGVSAIADDADGLPEVSTFTWQWLRASGGTDTAISGATSQTYTVAAADAGKKFKVTVSFTDLDGHPEALTSVAYPSDRQVAENAAPTFGSASVTRSVEETMGDSTVSTATDVGAAVTATDTDDDTLTYSLEGTDAAKFTIEAGSGQIRTKVGERYDRETKASYSVTVKAADGNGGEGSVSVVINVTNRNEAPLAPEAPTVEASAGRSSNLDVSWTAPANSGRPEIEHYDLRYRAANSSDWSNGPQKITGTEGAIRGVVGGAEYEVQVRAANAEGNGAWSRSGRATTVRTSIIADGTLRLVDGTMPREGRLEIFHDGEWGTICDDYFDPTEADLSCRLLGYDGAVEDWGRYRTGYFGPGTGPIVLDNLGCTGKESGLLQCPRHGGLAVREHNCRHTEDVSLRCGMAPRLVNIELSSSPGTDGRYDAGETIELTLVWSKAVVIETLAGYWPPKVWLFYEGDPGPGIGWRELLSPSYVRGSGTARTVFAVTLYSDGGSESSHWASFNTLRAEGNSLKLRSGSSIRSLDDGIDAQLGHDEYRWELQRQSLQVAAPAVAGLPEVSDPGADGAFAAGDRIEARVVFDAPVTVDGTGGTPTLGIALGGVRREASYESGSGTGTLTFALTVSDADGGAGAAKAVSNGNSAERRHDRERGRVARGTRLRLGAWCRPDRNRARFERRRRDVERGRSD